MIRDGEDLTCLSCAYTTLDRVLIAEMEAELASMEPRKGKRRVIRCRGVKM